MDKSRVPLVQEGVGGGERIICCLSPMVRWFELVLDWYYYYMIQWGPGMQ